MNQTIRTVAFEVQSASLDVLIARVTKFRNEQELEPEEPYAQLAASLPSLHFMSILVVWDATYDPLFLLEVNFDGDPANFWTALVAAVGRHLVEMLSFCKPPLDKAAGQRFLTMQTGGGAGLAGVLAEAAVSPTASHLGNRGLTCAQIKQEAALFKSVQTTLASTDAALRELAPTEIHKALSTALVPNFDWLTQRSPPRILVDEDLSDRYKLNVFLFTVVAVTASPGVVLALLFPWWLAAALGAATILLLSARIPDLVRLVSLSSTRTYAMAGLLTAIAIGGGVTISGLIGSILRAIVAIAPWFIGAVLFLLFWVRRLEAADSAATAPTKSPGVERLMAQREDKTEHIYQNHMCSVVMVKPGGLRSLLLRVGHQFLSLYLRVNARDGYLGDMRTVHFGHWALLNNNSRLLFMSNFDGTWDSYLDDFIEKASTGTTFA